MPAQASVVPSVRWTSVFLSLIPPLACVIAARAALGSSNDPIVVGLFSYLFFRLVVVRRIICRDHRAGIALTRSGKFPEAIAAFQRSEKFWERHPTLDRYRALLLGSPTSHGFLIFARYNQAYCLARLKRGAEARALLDDVLAKAPDMLPARELHDTLEAGSSIPT